MTKKILSVGLAILLALSLLSGCGKTETPVSPQPAQQEQKQEPAKQEQPAAQPEPAKTEPEPAEKKEEKPAVPAEPSLKLSKTDYPRVDGSTVTIPLSEAIYAKVTGCTADQATLDIKHNTTHYAYENLINGDCDLIFVTSPSEEELAMAKEAGVELEVIPIVSEAFVFLVSADNKIEGLTHQQILDIYSGKVTNWKDVGGNDVAIRAFQRPVNSGSQTGMLDLVMGDVEMAEAPTELVTAWMGELIDAVAVYTGEPDAIGYSYYYYVNDMWGYNKTKLIAIDGVMPNNDTVADGSYRYHTAYYAVIDKTQPANGNVRKLIDWILSPEGQALAEETGYVRVGK